MRSRSSGGTPGPRSETEMVTFLPLVLRSMSIGRSGGEYFSALLSRLRRTSSTYEAFPSARTFSAAERLILRFGWRRLRAGSRESFPRPDRFLQYL